MSDMSVTLTRAVFGMGNQNHTHVHRHNTIELGSMEVDKLKMEQIAGGILPSTLNEIAQSAGQLSARPQGYVSVEDGFNLRRGIGLLNFLIESNATLSSEMAVVGYLVGGTASSEGLTTDVLFVPVRCWSTLVTNGQDQHGFPMTKTVIEGSQQFLMGDPYQQKDLKSVRPIDVGNEALGFMVCEQEGRANSYYGTAGSDLRNNVLVSKTDNLNPTHHTRELLRLATVAGNESSHGRGLEVAMSDNLYGPGIGEISMVDNPFIQAMMFASGMHNLAGFQGFSIGEIMGVFDNFTNVLNVDMLNVSNFADDTNLLTSQEYGSANMQEILASELAMICIHLLLKAGLASLAFSATNDPTEFDGVSGADHGIVFLQGQAMPMMDSDMYVINRVENFKQLIAQHFFAKYTGPYAHMRHVISVAVDAHLFGEISVEITLNGEMHKTRRWTNASYYINHTSSSISGSEAGLLEAKNFLTNVKEHFI